MWLAFTHTMGHPPASNQETSMKRRSLVLSLALAAASMASVAQGYPERAVKLVVPYAPGGSADIVARLIANE